MASNDETVHVYQDHRERQIDNILKCAQNLFNKIGIEAVTMSSIAKAAGISRNTLYNYFPNKQEVAYGIFQRIIDDLPHQFKPVGESTESGYERLKAFMLGMVDRIEAHPDDSQFIAEFNILYAREGDPQRMRQIYAGGDDLLLSILQQGIADGSIRSNFSPNLLFAMIYNFFSAMNLRFSLTGSLIGEEYGQPVEALFRGIFRIFLQGLQPPNEG